MTIQLNDVLADDLKEYLEENLEGMAESHIEGWKSRYVFKKLETIEFDLRVNHDDSLELENVAEGIERELTDEEQTHVSELFIAEVLRILDNMIV